MQQSDGPKSKKEGLADFIFTEPRATENVEVPETAKEEIMYTF